MLTAGRPGSSRCCRLFLGLVLWVFPFPPFPLRLLLGWLLSRLCIFGGERRVEELLGVAGLRAGELDDPPPPHPLEQDLHVGLAVQAVDRSILLPSSDYLHQRKAYNKHWYYMIPKSQALD